MWKYKTGDRLVNGVLVVLCVGAVLLLCGVFGCEGLRESEGVQHVGEVIQGEQAAAVAQTVDTVGGLFGLPAVAGKTLEALGALWVLLLGKKGGGVVVKKLKDSKPGQLV